MGGRADATIAECRVDPCGGVCLEARAHRWAERTLPAWLHAAEPTAIAAASLSAALSATLFTPSASAAPSASAVLVALAALAALATLAAPTAPT